MNRAREEGNVALEGGEWSWGELGVSRREEKVRGSLQAGRQVTPAVA